MFRYTETTILLKYLKILLDADPKIFFKRSSYIL